MKKIFNISLLIVITAISLLFIINILLGSKVKFFSVVSGSMEPAIKAGSVIFTLKKDNYNQGDVISYRVKDGSVVTHRIVEVSQFNNEAAYTVRGDANSNNDPEPIWGNRVLGYQFFQIPYLGYLSLYLRSFQGLIIFVYIPAALLITREIYKIFKEIKIKKTPLKNNDNNNKRMDNIKRRVTVIIFALTVVIPPSYAYFYDTAIENGNIISTSTWSNLVINEVYFNLDEEHGREGKNEWIELYNNGTEPINLKGYAFQSTMGYFPITTNAVWIPAKGFALVSHDAQTWKIWKISKDTPTVNLPGNYAKADWLLAGGDCLYLKDNSAEVVDEVCWENDVPAGSSYSRLSPGLFDGWKPQNPDPGK